MLAVANSKWSMQTISTYQPVIELVQLMPAKAPVQTNECLIANLHPIDVLNSIGAWCSYFSTKINGHIMSMLHSSTAIARHQIDFGYKQGVQLQIKTTNM